MWQDLRVGVALVLVLEGILPFLSPSRYRRTMMLAAQIKDNTMRTLGLVCMSAGRIMLYVVR